MSSLEKCLFRSSIYFFYCFICMCVRVCVCVCIEVHELFVYFGD